MASRFPLRLCCRRGCPLGGGFRLEFKLQLVGLTHGKRPFRGCHLRSVNFRHWFRCHRYCWRRRRNSNGRGCLRRPYRWGGLAGPRFAAWRFPLSRSGRCPCHKSNLRPAGCTLSMKDISRKTRKSKTKCCKLAKMVVVAGILPGRRAELHSARQSAETARRWPSPTHASSGWQRCLTLDAVRYAGYCRLVSGAEMG